MMQHGARCGKRCTVCGHELAEPAPDVGFQGGQMAIKGTERCMVRQAAWKKGMVVSGEASVGDRQCAPALRRPAA